MRTSTRGKTGRRDRGFTLIEVAVVIFVLGLVLWLVAPRLAAVVEPGRNEIFRELSARSENAYDVALFEKKEVRLVVDPSGGTYRFREIDNAISPPPPTPFGGRLAVTGIRIDGNDRPLDIPTEIRYLPGGRLPDARIFLRDESGAGGPSDWTLKINAADGSVEVLEGKVVKDA